MKKSQTNGAASNVMFNTYGTLAYFFCQWLLTVFAARIGGYEVAGVFALSISFANIFNYVQLWGVRNFQVSDVENRFSTSQYAGVRVISTLFALLLFPPVLWFYHYKAELVVCCVISLSFKMLEGFTDLEFGVMQKQNRYDRIAVSYTLKGILPSVGFVACLVCKLPLAIAMGCMTLLYFGVVALYDAPRLWSSGIFRPAFAQNKEILSKCLPLMVNGLVSAWMIYLPRNAVQQQISSEALGYYSSVSTVVVVLSTLAGSVWAVLMPIISNMVQNREAQRLHLYLRRILLLLLGVSICALVFGNLLGPWAFGLVYGQSILDYMYLLNPVILNAVFLMGDAFFDCYFVPLGKRGQLLFCNASGLALCAATVTWATRQFGIVGACCSMTAGLILRFILLFVLNEWNLKKLSVPSAE